MLTYEVGKRMLRNTLQAVRWVSDKEYQQRIWIKGEGPNDFDETACYFFENSDPVLREHKLCDITESQYQILKKFRDKFREFSNEHSYELTFIDTPEWNEITEMAKTVLLAFNYQEMEKDK